VPLSEGELVSLARWVCGRESGFREVAGGKWWFWRGESADVRVVCGRLFLLLLLLLAIIVDFCASRWSHNLRSHAPSGGTSHPLLPGDRGRQVFGLRCFLVDWVATASAFCLALNCKIRLKLGL